MSDYISRDAAYESLLNGMVMTGYQSRALDCISEFSIPAADVRPVVRGKWIMNDECRPVCSLCGNVVAFVSHPDRRWDFGNYCPNCGADMRGESDA